jgi:hypothetical protein
MSQKPTFGGKEFANYNIYKNKTNKQNNYCLVYSKFLWQPTIKQLKTMGFKLHKILEAIDDTPDPRIKMFGPPKIFVNDEDVAIGLNFETIISQTEMELLGFKILEWS